MFRPEEAAGLISEGLRHVNRYPAGASLCGLILTGLTRLYFIACGTLKGEDDLRAIAH
jgi:hypothetical protein